MLDSLHDMSLRTLIRVLGGLESKISSAKGNWHYGGLSPPLLSLMDMAVFSACHITGDTATVVSCKLYCSGHAECAAAWSWQRKWNILENNHNSGFKERGQRWLFSKCAALSTGIFVIYLQQPLSKTNCSQRDMIPTRSCTSQDRLLL